MAVLSSDRSRNSNHQPHTWQCPTKKPLHSSRQNEDTASVPRSPQDSETYEPVIHDGLTNPANVQVLQQKGTKITTETEFPPIFLMRKMSPSYGYARVANEASISLEHFGGQIVFGIMYHRIGIDDTGTTCFLAPSPGRVQYVAIKILNKRALGYYLEAGGEEDPFVDLSRMQELGDNDHVLKCIEAIEDDKYLYIVTPRATDDNLGATLADAIPWSSGQYLDPARVQLWFRQILRILAYLESRGIYHGDLTPDNFLFLREDKLVAFDLASSLRMPYNQDGERILMKPQARSSYSSLQYVAPEVFHEKSFDGAAADLWSAVVILYNMLTNQVLYHIPSKFTGGCFKELPFKTVKTNFHRATPQTSRHNRRVASWDSAITHYMTPEITFTDAVELCEHVLQEDPSERWTLAQCMESRFVSHSGHKGLEGVFLKSNLMTTEKLKMARRNAKLWVKQPLVGAQYTFYDEGKNTF